jgi:3-oxoacyl-[acyl-carrier protein] reductase
MRGIDGRVALVTGAGRGIGAAIAARLVAEGASVLVNDLDAEAAHQVAAGLGDAAVACGGSVASPVDADAMVARVLECFGPVDILVNNAGLTRDAMLHRMTDEAWDGVVDVVLRGAFNLCRAAATSLRRDVPHHRKVVNITSVNGIYGTVGNVNYCSAKAGLIGLTKTLAREWGPRRVNVNAIAPGFIEGTRLTAVRDDETGLGIPRQVLDGIVAQIPIGRAGTAEDVAAMTAFLASSDADYVTGQVVELHGGLEIIRVVA